MATRTISGTQKIVALSTMHWLRIGLLAALGGILAVLFAQSVILVLQPGLAAFKPLDNFARSALFTLIPAFGATAVFAWLVKTQDHPISKFIWISAIILLLSFIPDFLLPLPNRTLVGSSAAAFLHLVAGIVTVTLILVGYARATKSSN